GGGVGGLGDSLARGASGSGRGRRCARVRSNARSNAPDRRRRLDDRSGPPLSRAQVAFRRGRERRRAAAAKSVVRPESRVKRFGVIVVAAWILSGIGCASSTEPATTLSPADLVASLADVANGRNADLLETGLALKTIELKLVVGREGRGGGRVSGLVLDAR